MWTETLSGSRVLSAISILMVQLGARYLSLDLDRGQELLFQEPLVRRVVLFCVLFLATRDLWVSLIISVVATLLLEFSREKEIPAKA